MTLPADFTAQMQQILDADEAARLFAALGEEPKVSVRRNTSKCAPFSAGSAVVPWCPDGKYLVCREAFTFDPLLHGGAYYVQDASSMIIATIVRRLTQGSGPVCYLDLCAAPGGKSTAAIDALPSQSLVVCNEIMNNRAQVLRENIIKWGSPYCVVSNNDSAAIARLGAFFDIIAADVPCSGEGMFRKDDEAVSQWTPALVEQCAARQREIIDNAWKALKPGGFLIYSTCTFNREENEEMIEYIVAGHHAESVDLHLDSDFGIRRGIGTAYHCYRFMPHITDGEGLFVAVLRKSADELSMPAVRVQAAKPRRGNEPAVDRSVGRWLVRPDDFQLSMVSDTVVAIPRMYSGEIAALGSTLRVIHRGIAVATAKGRDLVPTQSLALSTALSASAFERVEVPYEAAIAYLRGESICIDAPRGIVALTYRGTVIGFVKNLGNRANNLYPKEWRIKSTHLPGSIPEVV
ncbi:MAG: rRNA cytosine-C5-methyltransferase [Muribaculaceae bacterium]|nr:rRNA cytosine-C5-methyltransferase [Muribaculaceae bacterium]